MTPQTLTLIFYLTLTLSIVFFVLSLGWMSILFAVIFIPLFILHLMAGIKAMHYFPESGTMLLISCICFFIFFLIRPDFGDQYGYNSASRIADLAGWIKSPALSDNLNSAFMSSSIALFVGQIVLDVMILFKKFII